MELIQLFKLMSEVSGNSMPDQNREMIKQLAIAFTIIFVILFIMIIVFAAVNLWTMWKFEKKLKKHKKILDDILASR